MATKDKKEDKPDIIKSLVVNSIQNNKEHVYNGRKRDINYKISTGSYRLDTELGGGISKGIVRLCGASTAGKTSELFTIVGNAFKQIKKCRCIYVPAEGRDNIWVMERLGLKFTENPEDWDNHTVFAFVTNVYEAVADLAYQVIKANEKLPEKEQEVLILAIDSLDCLILKDDLEKESGEAHKVAGPQFLTKKLWQKLAVPFNYGGHLALITSMQSTNITLNPYSSTKTPKRMTSGAGGTALNHFANTILEFVGRNNSDYILEDNEEKYHPTKNRKVGHNVTIQIVKSSNEVYDHLVQYPIKYGANNEGSIWNPRELTEMALDRDLISKKGSIFTFGAELTARAKAAGIELPETLKGMYRVYDYLENNPNFVEVVKETLDVLIKAEKMAKLTPQEEETEI